MEPSLTPLREHFLETDIQLLRLLHLKMMLQFSRFLHVPLCLGMLLIMLSACDNSLIVAPEGTYYESGIASWYGDGYHGKPTANGEVYNMEALTAAHKTLPFNTLVRVVNRDNGKTVTVRINDRGPFVEGRVIDLSRKAAREIGIITSGLARVELYIILEG